MAMNTRSSIVQCMSLLKIITSSCFGVLKYKRYIRFATTAEILEPISLRNKFKELYQSGLNNYI